jgi:hypothetical protein
MPVKFIDDGQPESADFDDNYLEIRHAHKTARGREWRTVALPHPAAQRIIAPGDVRFFQWMETPAAQTSSHWKPSFLRRLFC